MRKNRNLMGIMLISLLGISFIGLFLVNDSINTESNDAFSGLDFPVINTSAANTSRNVSINPATPEDNYTIRLDLNSSFDYGSCLPGGDDIRFYDSSNNSLSYWIEDWNDGGTSTIWIKVLQSGTTSITMEYGNSGASAASNGEETFVFFDDFLGSSLNLSKWYIIDDSNSNVTVANGTVELYADSPENIRVTAVFGFTDYHAEFPNTIIAAGIGTGTDSFKTHNGITYQESPYSLKEKWTKFEFAWINSSLVRYYGNDTLIAEHDQTVPPIDLPLRFTTRVVSGGNDYGASISSVNDTLGRPGYSVRTYSWNSHDYTATPGGTPAKHLADWVFVRKCTVIEPVAMLNIPLPPLNHTIETLYINPATPEDNYTIRLDLDGSFDYGNCLPNGNDIRFYDASNNSLSYWIEDWNYGGTSTIWIKVIQSGTTSIKMEHGNDSAPAASNGEDTFLFFEDFSGSSLNSSKWNSYTDVYSSLSVGGGELYLNVNTPQSNWILNWLGFGELYGISGQPTSLYRKSAALFLLTGAYTSNNTYYSGSWN
ncbi:MAG: DUF2341 domain-containing protein, partial [Candidatus Hodarchaeota archaeon]